MFKDLGCLKIGFGKMGSEYFLISPVSDGGSGGTGGFGGWGDGNSGGKVKVAAAAEAVVVGRCFHEIISPMWMDDVRTFICSLLRLIMDLLLMIDQLPSLDLKRALLFTFLGLVLVGPTLHFGKLVTIPGASGAFLRLLLDQFHSSPTFIGVFLSTLITLEGRPSQVVLKLQQVLAANCVALAWNVILSFKAHKEILPK